MRKAISIMFNGVVAIIVAFVIVIALINLGIVGQWGEHTSFGG
ncbi:MAG TPA: hypothetical protein VFI76_04540 [Terrimicrobiaceae bacterium]|jgi:Uncharacterized protein conserved in bacteria (DUF2188)|nr:hypothetical protein [Terrimicrobiaceae bacterium]